MVRAVSKAFSLVSSAVILCCIFTCLCLLLEPHDKGGPPLHLIDPSYGVIQPLSSSRNPRLAVATFLSHDGSHDWDDSDFENDQSFVGTRILAYQLLYANETRLRDPSIDFIVLVTPTVSQAKRQQLILDGCTLVDVDTPPLPSWLPLNKTRYAADHFSKLRLFSLVHYHRVLYLSPSTILTRRIDSIFHDVFLRTPSTNLASSRPEQVRLDEAPLPANYMFAARSDHAVLNRNDPYWHGFPSRTTETFSSSTLLIAPSPELYNLVLSALHSKRSKKYMEDFYHRKYSSVWFKNAGPDHALLNHVFRRSGTMPWTELDPRWTSNWANQKDFEEQVASLHGEYWWGGPWEMREVWTDWKGRMEAEFA